MSRIESLPLLLMIALLCGSCDVRLRDEYMDDNWLKPAQDANDVKRDAWGDPILPRRQPSRAGQ